MVPFTILTGWLGAGKTTALNRMLSAVGPAGAGPTGSLTRGHGRRIAVLVNELGRIAIDGRLILGGGGDVLELAGGCVCCKIDTKNDLWDGIADVIARSSPEQVVLETTGIAEPAAILETLAHGPLAQIARDKIEPAGVVCVVDAEDGARALDRRDEAREQLAAADRVMLSKLDVAPAAAVRDVHARIAALAPAAERAAFPAGDAGALAMASWVLERRAVRARAHHAPHRHGQLVAVAFAQDGARPLVAALVEELVRGLGDRLVRAKGWIAAAGERGVERIFVEKAGARIALSPAAWDGEPRTELVLIGELDEQAVSRALWACSARS